MKSRMRLFRMIAAFTVAIATVSCDKNHDTTQKTEDIKAEKLCTYIYDGKEYPVYTAEYAENTVSLIIKISPLEKEQSNTTYAAIGINTSLEGYDIDVEKAWNNDDYYFIYEDPVRYYSQYRKLKSGTIYIKKSGEHFDVHVDVILPDGTDFQFEYSGTIASATL